jgi:protein deglycase
MNLRALVLLAPGFEEIEALTPVDVLRRAGLDVQIVAVADQLLIVGARGIAVMADCLVKDVDFSHGDVVVLPGGMPGTLNLNASDLVKTIVRHQYESGRLVAAICAAPMILGQMGLLKGQTVTCYPGFESYLEGAIVSSSSVEVDLPIITGRGVGAALQFSLKIVSILLGETIANDLAQKMVVD